MTSFTLEIVGIKWKMINKKKNHKHDMFCCDVFTFSHTAGFMFESCVLSVFGCRRRGGVRGRRVITKV